MSSLWIKRDTAARRLRQKAAMTVHTGTALLLLGLGVSCGDTRSNPTAMPMEEILRKVVVGHYHAIEDNQIDEAMSYYHSQSPQASQARENIEFGLSAYWQKTTTMSFRYIGRDKEFAKAKATHRYLIIMGVKFIEQSADIVYLFREERGAWKVWTKGRLSKYSGD